MSRSIRVILVASLVALALVLAGCGSTELEGTSWRLKEWSVSSSNPREFPVTVTFGGGRVSGQGPINSYGGRYTTSWSDGFSLKDVAVTGMAGQEPAMRAEGAYFALLRKARKYRLNGDVLTLLDENGNELLIFEPTR